VGRKLSVSDQFLLAALKGIADEIADHEDAIKDIRNRRDDLIREGIEAGIPKAQLARATEMSREQIRNIEGFRYSRDARRQKNIHGGPERA